MGIEEYPSSEEGLLVLKIKGSRKAKVLENPKLAMVLGRVPNRRNQIEIRPGEHRS